MRVLARVNVLVTVVLVFTAMIAAQSGLDHRSNAYFATFMFVPIVLGPALLVGARPIARTFTIWALSSAVGSTMYLLGTEREYVSVVMLAAIFTSFVGATSLAWASCAVEAVGDSARARRISSIAKLAPVVGITACVIAPLIGPGRFALEVLIVVGFTIAPASFVMRAPTRRNALLWAAWALPFGALATMVTTTSSHLTTLEEVFVMAIGTLAALLVAVLPLSALRRSEPDGALLAPAITRR